MNEWLINNLCCPRHQGPVALENGVVVCPQGCKFPVVDGIPVMLNPSTDHTLWVAEASLEKAWDLHDSPQTGVDYCVGTLGITPTAITQLERILSAPETNRVDPVISYLVGATNGILYEGVVGSLNQYPIPEMRLPESGGEVLLDIGCNWGRWSMAAARRGYFPVGLDPSLGAVLAAQRLFRKMGHESCFVVGDARHLPFREGSFDVAFSYSVLQHFKKSDARASISEARRVLKPGGRALIQMPNMFGIRSLYHLARRRFRKPMGFEVRYWRPGELLETFCQLLGPSSLSVDCFFGLGIQQSDRELLSGPRRIVVDAARAVLAISDVVKPMKYLADSLYIESNIPTA